MTSSAPAGSTVPGQHKVSRLQSQTNVLGCWMQRFESTVMQAIHPLAVMVVASFSHVVEGMLGQLQLGGDFLLHSLYISEHSKAAYCAPSLVPKASSDLKLLSDRPFEQVLMSRRRRPIPRLRKLPKASALGASCGPVRGVSNTETAYSAT